MRVYEGPSAVEKRKEECMNDQEFQERRKHPRYPVSLNVTLAFIGEKKRKRIAPRIGGTGRNISGRTGDISFEGLLVKANPLHQEVRGFFTGAPDQDLGFLLDLEIELDGQRIHAGGQIKWFKLWYTGKEPYQLETGVFIRDMDSETRKWWDEYFKNLHA
jgi:hypothetical protein